MPSHLRSIPCHTGVPRALAPCRSAALRHEPVRHSSRREHAAQARDFLLGVVIMHRCPHEVWQTAGFHVEASRGHPRHRDIDLGPSQPTLDLVGLASGDGEGDETTAFDALVLDDHAGQGNLFLARMKIPHQRNLIAVFC
jgi:hypothetical protein